MNSTMITIATTYTIRIAIVRRMPSRVSQRTGGSKQVDEQQPDDEGPDRVACHPEQDPDQDRSRDEHRDAGRERSEARRRPVRRQLDERWRLAARRPMPASCWPPARRAAPELTDRAPPSSGRLPDVSGPTDPRVPSATGPFAEPRQRWRLVVARAADAPSRTQRDLVQAWTRRVRGSRCATRPGRWPRPCPDLVRCSVAGWDGCRTRAHRHRSDGALARVAPPRGACRTIA